MESSFCESFSKFTNALKAKFVTVKALGAKVGLSRQRLLQNLILFTPEVVRFFFQFFKACVIVRELVKVRQRNFPGHDRVVIRHVG